MKYPQPALWRVALIIAHDGDTVKLDVDRGIEESATWDIRLKDVFAPELSQPGGTACRDHLLGWFLDNADGSDWPFQLQTYRTPNSDVEVKSFDRYVGVITSSKGMSLNDEMTKFIKDSGYGGGIGS